MKAPTVVFVHASLTVRQKEFYVLRVEELFDEFGRPRLTTI
jgi:hypothetical protein